MAEYPQKPPLKVQMRHIHFGSQVTHLEESTKTNRPLNRTLVSRDICAENDAAFGPDLGWRWYRISS